MLFPKQSSADPAEIFVGNCEPWLLEQQIKCQVDPEPSSGGVQERRKHKLLVSQNLVERKHCHDRMQN